MTTDKRLVIERKWIAAVAERDRLRAAARTAKRSGEVKALAAAEKRVQKATKRCKQIMARYQKIVSPPNMIGLAVPAPTIHPPKAAPSPPDTRKTDTVRESEGGA